MRRSKGFILAEILISMMLQAGFVIVLCGAFYLLVSFESDVQMKLVARQRGQRVIQYIDQRIRNAGVGFRDCTYYVKEKRYLPRGSKGVREALAPLTANDGPLYSSKNNGLKLPVALSNLNKDNPKDSFADASSFATSDDTSNNIKIQYGNILTLLYAERNTDSNVNLVISVEATPSVTQNNITRIDADNPLGLTSAWNNELAKNFINTCDSTIFRGGRTSKNVSDTYNKNIGNGFSISTSLFCAISNRWFSELTNKEESGNIWNEIKNIREKISDDLSEDIYLKDIYFNYTYKFISGKNEELDNSQFYQFERNPTIPRKQYINAWGVMAGTGVPFIVYKTSNPKEVELKFADDVEPGFDIHTGDEILYLKCQRMFVNGTLPDRNFDFQELTNEWSDAYHYQDGILEIFFALDRNKHILDLYVLSSGGTDGKIHERPKKWPSRARWNNNYQYHVTHVSHASWKLENIYYDEESDKRFNWNS